MNPTGVERRGHLADSWVRGATVLLATGNLVAAVWMHGTKNDAGTSVKAENTKPIDVSTEVRMLDGETRKFQRKTEEISYAPACFPIHIRTKDRTGIMYLYCSREAERNDTHGVTLTENIQVPDGLARRYNFWRRVYSLWGKNQFVLHLSAYPEVVLEAYDMTRIEDPEDPRWKPQQADEFARPRIEAYRKLLLTLHNHRDRAEAFTPAMERVAGLMSHIDDPRKFLVAARSLRVQRGQRDFIEDGLETGSKYLPHIREQFREEGVPEELSLLAFVESSFNLNALSKAGASGVYQIMPATGRQYLKIRGGIDERNDPIKAGAAAAKLLKLNYRLTERWPLAITAYNHGVGSIQRAIRQVGSRDIVDIIQEYDRNTFGFASKNFFASYLGLLATLRDKNRLFPEHTKLEPLDFRRVRLDRSRTVSKIRQLYDLNTQTIRDLNPDLSWSLLRRGGPLPAGYVLKIPGKRESGQVAKVQEAANS